MQSKDLELQILVGGEPLPEVVHEGHTYVEALNGRQFELKFKNRTRKRILVVPTVDGLSAMDGESGSYDGNGYVLRGFQEARIPGFRLDDAKVAHFTFGAKEGSYAAGVGRPTNVGVIGVAVFHERFSLEWSPYYSSGPIRQRNVLGPTSFGGGVGAPMGLDSLRDAGSPPPEMRSIECSTSSGSMGLCEPLRESPKPQPIQHAGTEFGKKVEHKVTQTSFYREEDSPSSVLELHYDFRAGLDEKGVPVPSQPAPQAFPENHSGCTPPAGWEG